MFEKLKEQWLYGASLGVTLLFFLYKGILYSVIGSYLPMAIIAVIIALLIFGMYRSTRTFVRVLWVWSILVILWAGVRLLLSAMLLFVKPISEAHVSEQLGLAGSLVSLLFLFCGVYLWRYRKRLQVDKAPVTS